MKGEYFYLFYSNAIFGIAKNLAEPVSTMVLCEDDRDQRVCCKIILVFILYCVLTKLSAPHCNYIEKVLPY